MKFQFLPENFSRSENAPPFETRKIRHFEVERIFLENKKMVQEYQTTTGSIKNISLPERIITLDTGVIIHLDDISYIGGSIFSEMMEDS